MTESGSTRRWPERRRLIVGAAAAGAVAALAGCGGSSGGRPASAPASPTGAADPAVTVAAASVPGVGTVLVNGEGRTLYILTSEQGGRITCTDDNGCTRVWPDTELHGTTHGVAGSGVQASMLGTIRDSTGSLYLTYGGWPLYTYSGDPGPGHANGQGIVSFGGTWETLSPEGSPVRGASSMGGGATTSSGTGSGY
jgi:predicted lipoprotein with Yx(FWY)xxD motif